MAVNIQFLNLGTTPNDNTGDPARTGGQKINNNFNNLKTAVDALEIEVDGKAPIVHTHVISDVTGLQSALDTKVAGSGTTNFLPIWTSANAIGSSLIESTTDTPIKIGDRFVVNSVAFQSTFLGVDAGLGATNADNSIFIGRDSGFNATNAFQSNFLGVSAGNGATGAYDSNFLGSSAGLGATNAYASNFLGANSGYNATNAYASNFLGITAGYNATNASFSNLFGYNVGRAFTNNNIGSNNIIIGTNISLPNLAANRINLGGVIFGFNTNSDTSGGPKITASVGGRVSIGNATDNGVDTLQVSGTTIATGYKTPSGTASQFLKANGTVDSATYFPSPTGLTTNNLTKWNGTTFANSNVSDNGTLVTVATDMSVNGMTVGTRGVSSATAVGNGAGAVATGTAWTASGFQAGYSNTTGNNWTAVGSQAGYSNTTGDNWTAVGYRAGYSNTTGISWTANGLFAGYSNTTGINWTANGNGAGYSNTTGSYWTATGMQAGYSNTTGNDWTATGYQAGYSNTTGISWIATGYRAARYLADGTTAATSFSNSVYVGTNTRVSANGVVNENVFGYLAIGLGSNTNVIGNSSSVFSRIWGNLLVGTSVNNGVDALQVTGSGRFTDDLTVNGMTVGTRGVSTGTAVGNAAGRLATGNYWTANGFQAGYSNTTGTGWTANGFQAGYSNTTGINWTALGSQAGLSNTTGNYWTAAGYQAGFSNTTGIGWVALGNTSAYSSTLSSNFTAVGASAGFYNQTGDNWVSVGRFSSVYLADGVTNATSFSNSTYVGTNTRVSSNGVTNENVFGYNAIGLGSNTNVIGNSSSVFSRIWGNLLVGTSVNNGVDALQVSGTAISTAWKTTGGTTSQFVTGTGSLVDFATTVRSSVLTGYVSGAGTVSATDTVLQAIQKLNGNDALKAPLANPTFTGSVVVPNAVNANEAVNKGQLDAFVPSVGSLEFNATDKTVWNNGKGDIATNTSFGDLALKSNTTGINNTAYGASALLDNTTGSQNTANGVDALKQNTTGGANVAIGFASLTQNTTGNFNSAIGQFSLNGNTQGYYNTAHGGYAAVANTTGNYNIGVGMYSLYRNTTGNNNTGIGVRALNDLNITNNSNSNNTAIGAYTGIGIVTGINNTILGANIGGLASDLSNNIILSNGNGTNQARFNGTNWTFDGQINKSSLDTAPASATATGTVGEIRVTSTHIYVCTATNTWVRSALTTW